MENMVESSNAESHHKLEEEKSFLFPQWFQKECRPDDILILIHQD